MARITRITTQKKNRGRYNIFLDRGHGEEFGFGVGEDVLVAFALGKDKEIDEEELQTVIFEDEIKWAFNQAVNYLSYRMRSVKEIKDFLHNRDINPEVIPTVLERLGNHQYIDDPQFAKMFARSRKQTTTKGPGVIRRELEQKGVGQEDIEQALQDYSVAEQVQTAAGFAAKQANMPRKKSSLEMKQDIKRTLMGKGFSHEVIDTAIAEAVSEKGEDEEWDALVAQSEKAHRKYQKYAADEYARRMKQYLYRKGFPLPLIERYLRDQH